jgi:transposase
LKVSYERALFAIVANRLTDPDSKLGLWERWLSTVYIPSCRSLKLEQIYEAMDLFYDHMSEVEKEIFFQTANLLNLEVDLIFYDTTTASFSIDYEDSFRAFGHSKEGNWSPQVVVALAVTREGFPVRSWVFPGNTTDVATVIKIRDDLRGWKLGRTLFVADSGMNSIENKKELSRACGTYLLASRMSSVSEIRDAVLSKRGRYTIIRDNLHAKEVIAGEGERRNRYVLCYNPLEAKRQKKHRAEIVAFLEKELDRHQSKKATARWAIELLASRRYKRYLTITKSGNIRIDRNKVKESAKYDGKWVIETNDDTITLEDAACGYKGLMVIERCFRSMKRTQIKMCPMYHWTPPPHRGACKTMRAFSSDRACCRGRMQ